MGHQALGRVPLFRLRPARAGAHVSGRRVQDHGDLVEVAFGSQGLAMIPYRIHVDGEPVPACAHVTATLGLETMTSPDAIHDVRLRCGDSLRVQDILPALPCEEREYPVTLDVTLEGVGSVSLTLRAMGGGCMFGG